MLKDFIENNLDNVTFYCASFRRYMVIAFVLLLINFCLLAYLYFNQLSIVQAKNFATTSDGRLIEIHPGDVITQAQQVVN